VVLALKRRLGSIVQVAEKKSNKNPGWLPSFYENFLHLVNITIMGFNKKYVPELKKLKAQLDEYPENLKYYLNADALIGSAESMKYLDKLWEKQRKAEVQK